MTATTTPTTQSPSRLFSLPYRNRKRSAGPNVTIPPTCIVDGPAHALQNNFSRPHTPVIPVDKALPPTPLEEPAPVDLKSTSIDDTARISASPAPSIRIRTHKLSSGNSSTGALAHAALGLGLPHASTSFPHEASTIPFIPPSPISVPLQPISSIRKVKSSQRIQLRHASDTHENASKADQLERRRQRGLSFTATSFLNDSGFEGKGKGKEMDTGAHIALESKPLSRKASFWSKKKSTRPPQSPVVSDSAVFPLPILPPMDQSSPFDISDLRLSSSPTKLTSIYRPPNLPPSYSETGASPAYAVSVTPYARPTSAPSGHQVVESPSKRSLESRPSLDPPPVLRARAQTNTPLLRRLSMGVFSSGEPSPATSTRSNTLSQSLSASPIATTLKAESPAPKPSGDESPEEYVMRLKSKVGKAEIAGILASSADRFYAQALRSFISQFNFLDIPIDVALRKMLMEVGLPRETQQIDRVMEAFASQYMACNVGVFISEDHPYILAFSLIMLHTDAFNPSNKRKMSKADYIKNTTIPGIPAEVLDCLFDNIVFAPFIYIEDPADSNGQTNALSADPNHNGSLTSPASAALSVSGTGSFKIGNKVDPYFLIANNLLQSLRVDVNISIPFDNPFTYEGSNGPWDEHKLHDSFLHAPVVDVNIPLAPRTMFGLGSVNSMHLSPIAASSSSSVNSKFELCSIQITKVGLLNRKDDLLEGGKKASSRKWRPCSIILTGYQLLLFRGPTWAATLSKPFDGESQPLAGASLTELFRPDESFSLKDAIAIYDRTYTKYDHTMRLVLPDGRQVLFQAHDTESLNDWIAMINYACAFKSTGVRMRPPGLSGEDVMLTGVAAATSHLHDMQSRSGLRRPRSWDNDTAHDLMDMLSAHSNEKPLLKRRVTTSERNYYDADAPVAPEVEGAEQFKATFDQVKADLAASSWSSSPDGLWTETGTACVSPSASATSLHSSNIGLPSRSQIIQNTVGELDAKIQSLQSDLDADLRHARNIAILTPFQKSTRSRLAAAVQNMSKHIASARIEIERTKCYRDVLRCDLASEGRTWDHSKQLALRAAKETLQSRKELPALDTSTSPTQVMDPTSPLRSAGTTRPSHHPDSSTDGSFYSATDFGMDWPSSDDLKSLCTNSKSSRKLTLSTASSGMSDVLPLRHLSPSDVQRPLSHPDTSSSVDDLDEPNVGEEEQAEEWNRTRCAQRVSLIHVPSNIGLLTRLRSTVDQS